MSEREGWVCARCGRSYSPLWFECSPCNRPLHRAQAAVTLRQSLFEKPTDIRIAAAEAAMAAGPEGEAP